MALSTTWTARRWTWLRRVCTSWTARRSLWSNIRYRERTWAFRSRYFLPSSGASETGMRMTENRDAHQWKRRRRRREQWRRHGKHHARWWRWQWRPEWWYELMKRWQFVTICCWFCAKEKQNDRDLAWIHYKLSICYCFNKQIERELTASFLFCYNFAQKFVRSWAAPRQKASFLHSVCTNFVISK